jgi:hypothetical protein
VTHQLEVGIPQEVRDIAFAAGIEVIDAKYVVALLQQAFA